MVRVGRIGPLALALVVLTAGPVAAWAGAGPTSTTPGPTTPGPTTPGPTVPGTPVPPPYVPDLGPPPPPFAPGEDSGRRLLLDQDAAALEVAAAEIAVVDAEAALPRIVAERHRLAVRHDLAVEGFTLATRALDRHARRLAQSSADLYVEASPIDSLASIDAMVEADSVMALSRIEELRAAQRDALAARRSALQQRLTRASSHRGRTANALAAANDRVLAARRAVVVARAGLVAARARVAALEAEEDRWLIAAARTSASPIMGPSALDVDDLVRQVLAVNPDPNLTVPIEELAAMFLEEGEAEGVRGDVAFAQSILETGSFSNPGCCSIVVWTDNNFAGIGACDSCEHGRVFATARDGVRAQIQALRTYADPTVDGPDDYANPMVLPQQLEWIRAGRTKTWYELTGKWATGAGYGLHIFDVYRPMYAQRTESPPPPDPVVRPGPADGARSIAGSRVAVLRAMLVG